MIAPYPNLHEIDSSGNCGSDRYRALCGSCRCYIRQLRNRLIGAENMRTAFNDRGDLITFFRTQGNGYPICYYSVPIRRITCGMVYGENLGDHVLRTVCSGKMALRRKLDRQRQAEESDKRQEEEDFNNELEDSSEHLYDVASRNLEQKGMSRHFQKSHLIENNPLHS